MKKISSNILSIIIRKKFEQLNLSSEHIEYMVSGLVGPSLRGVDSHGIRLLPTYIKALEGGRCKSKPNLIFDDKRPAAIQLDADQALGIVASYEAVFRAIDIAKDMGIALVSVKNSSHFGAASNYTLAAADKGFLGICMSNADRLVAPHNGTEKIFGTNPISFAAPALAGENFCLDMATSQVSFSKVMMHLNNNQRVDENWVVDADNAEASALLPLGGYKGQGLAMLVSILSGILNQTPLDHELDHVYSAPYDVPHKVGHTIIVINIEAFIPLATFQSNLAHFMEIVRSSQSATGESVLVAGDKERTAYAQRIKTGIPLNDIDFSFYSNLAQEMNIEI